MNKVFKLLVALLVSVFILGGCGPHSGSPPDLTPPALSASEPTSPANGATGVPLNTAVTITFTEPIDPGSLTSGTFSLTTGGTMVQGVVSVSGNKVIFQPDSDLAPNTTYGATLSPGLEDMAGNVMTSGYTWSFVTGAAPDTTPPTVTAGNPTSPADGASGVAVDAPITLSFSEAITAGSVTSGTFTLVSADGTTIQGALSVQGNTITFQPSSALAYATSYTATAKAGITDLAGNPLGSDYSWGFITAAAPDTTPPTAAASNPAAPADGATGVALDTSVTLTFSEPIAAGSVTSGTFTLSTGGTAVTGTLSVQGDTITFQPSANLAYATSYTATAKAGITDLAGNPLGSDYAWGFTTVAAPSGPAWGTPTMLNTSGTTTYSASNDGSLVKMDGQGHAIVIWWQFNPTLLTNELWTSRYTAPGGAAAGGWSTPSAIVPAAVGQTDIRDPALAMNSSGQAILVWAVYVSANNQTELYSRYYDPASGWGATEAVNSASGGRLMRVVLDDAGTATMVWERSKANPANPSTGFVKTVGANRYVPGSGWSGEALLEDLDFTDPYSYVKVPTLALDAAGNVTAVWVMDDSTGYYVHASRLAGGTWSSPVAIYTTPDYIDYFMAAGADGNGNVTVAWRRNGGSNASNLTLWSARYDAQGGAWSTPVTLVDSAGLGTYDLAVDAAGTAMLAWDQKPATDMELLARLYTPGAGWGTAVSVVGTSPYTANDSIPALPRIAATSGGAFWVGWQMPGQASSLAIYANQYLPGTGWGTPNVARDLANTSDRMPRIDANAGGDAILTWGGNNDNGTWARLYR